MSNTFNELSCLPNPHKFSIMIEQMARSQETGYVDTIINYCEENDIEYETIAKLVNPTLKDKIKKEFSEKHNLLPKTTKLLRKA